MSGWLKKMCLYPGKCHNCSGTRSQQRFGAHMPRDTQATGKAARYPGFISLFLVWTLVGVLAYARHYLQERQLGSPAHLWPELLDWLSCFLPWALLAPFVFRLEERFPLARDRWLRNLPLLAVAGLVPSYLAFEGTVWLGVGIDFV